MPTLPELGAGLCLAAIIVILVVFFLLWFVFKFLIAFFPSIVVALIVWLVSGNWIIAAVAFVLSAILFAALGAQRRRPRY
jgi:membrane protein implicated in regulation of membrane protease activity